MLFVLGLLLITGSGVGLYSTGGFRTVTQAGSALGLFNVTFATSTVDGGTKTVPSYSSGSQTFDVKQTNITKATFVLQCTDPAGGTPAYQITVSVAGPNGLKSDPKTVTCSSSAPVEVTVTGKPANGAVQGSTEDQARANLENDPNATKAVGTWTVSYSGARQTLPIPPAVGQVTPSGSIKLNLDQWQPKLTPESK